MAGLEKAADRDEAGTRSPGLGETMNLHDFYHDDGKVDGKDDEKEDEATRDQASSPDPAPHGSGRPRKPLKVQQVLS